jgi:hypothetical protein
MNAKGKIGRPPELGERFKRKLLELPHDLFLDAQLAAHEDGKPLARWIRDAMLQALATRKRKA